MGESTTLCITKFLIDKKATQTIPSIIHYWRNDLTSLIHPYMKLKQCVFASYGDGCEIVAINITMPVDRGRPPPQHHHVIAEHIKRTNNVLNPNRKSNSAERSCLVEQPSFHCATRKNIFDFCRVFQRYRHRETTTDLRHFPDMRLIARATSRTATEISLKWNTEYIFCRISRVCRVMVSHPQSWNAHFNFPGLNVYSSSFSADLYNIRPARTDAFAENVATARLRIHN